MTRDEELIAPKTLALPARIAIILVTLLCSAILAKTIFTHKLSEAFFKQPNLLMAHSVNPHDGMIAGKLSSLMQGIGNYPVTEKVALGAVKDTTLAERGIATLAIADAIRDPSLSARLLSYAATLGWRDERVQIRLARAALDRSDVTDAARRIDAAANTQGLQEGARGLIDTMTTSAPALRAISARLALNPSWRPEYLTGIKPPVGSIDARTRILATLDSAHLPVTELEKSAVILIAAKFDGLSHAYDVWLALYKPSLPHMVFDPQFRITDDGADFTPPFVWQFHSPAGISTDLDGDNNRPALHVVSDGTAVGPVAQQFVRIPPGHHILTTSGRYSAPAAASGFRWVLICVDEKSAAKPVLPSSGSAIGNAHFGFDIPADGTCPIQRLALQAQSAEQPGQIEAWFNDVRVE